MKTYELSVTVTSHCVTTVQAETPEEALKACEAHHSPDSVAVHSVREAEPPVEDGGEREDCPWCRYATGGEGFHGCDHPENTEKNREAFWAKPNTECFEAKPHIVEAGSVITESGEKCPCGEAVITDGISEWCPGCSNLEGV